MHSAIFNARVLRMSVDSLSWMEGGFFPLLSACVLQSVVYSCELNLLSISLFFTALQFAFSTELKWIKINAKFFLRFILFINFIICLLIKFFFLIFSSIVPCHFHLNYGTHAPSGILLPLSGNIFIIPVLQLKKVNNKYQNVIRIRTQWY